MKNLKANFRMICVSYFDSTLPASYKENKM